MRLYFVRHGESVGNVHHIHQNSSTPLSEIGIDQARFVAHRFKHIPIDLLLASDYVRTTQTAKEICAVINKEIEFEPLLREIKRPTEIEGMAHTSPKATKIHKQIDDHKYDPLWHFSDEENYYDVYNRAKKFLTSLPNRNVPNCLAVTHGIFLRMCLTVVFYPDQLNVDFLDRTYAVLKTTNTGITAFEFENNSWRVLTFNDYAHLA